LYTTTVEAFIQPNGRSLQAATSHCLGQGFAKAFGIQFEDDKGTKTLPVQNSWGISTRSIGAMIMVHGDNKGLKLPPAVAPIQVIVVPIYKADNITDLDTRIKSISSRLNAVGVRLEVDSRTDKTPGWKFNHWEMKGVPLRLEFGDLDVQKGQIVAVRRDNAEKTFIPLDNIESEVKRLLEAIQKNLFESAKKVRDDHLKTATTWEEFLKHLNNRNIVLVPFCGKVDCEVNIRQKSSKESQEIAADIQFGLTGSAKSLCSPLTQPVLEKGTKCFACDSEACVCTMFGRSY